LAEGELSNGDIQYLQLIHPKVGNCYDKKSRENSIIKTKSWKECHKQILTWIPKWVKKIKFITLEHEDCMINDRAVSVYIDEPNPFIFFYFYNPRGSLELPEISYWSYIELNHDDCKISTKT
jgi:hypothetical protein